MAQILFGSDTTPALGDLDANFTELYSKTAYATTGIGYANGAGGSVTQLTSKSTAVTINKLTGQITMNAASLAAGAGVSFAVLNSLVASTDCVKLSSGGFGIGYRVEEFGVTTGRFDIRVTNVTGSALAEGLIINFVVIRGAAS